MVERRVEDVLRGIFLLEEAADRLAVESRLPRLPGAGQQE
jgi:hypothetical protein